MIKKYIYIALAICLALICAAVGFAGYFIGKFRSGCEVDYTTKVDTVLICKTDTLRIFAHDTIVVSKIGYKYVAVHDTVVEDSIVYMPLPITQKWYHEDSLCDVWVSGYEPNLDSMHIVQRHTVEIIKEREIIEGGRNIVGFEAGIKEANIMYLREVGKFNVGVSAGSTYQGEPTGRIVVGFHF